MTRCGRWVIADAGITLVITFGEHSLTRFRRSPRNVLEDLVRFSELSITTQQPLHLKNRSQIGCLCILQLWSLQWSDVPTPRFLCTGDSAKPLVMEALFSVERCGLNLRLSNFFRVGKYICSDIRLQ